MQMFATRLSAPVSHFSPRLRVLRQFRRFPRVSGFSRSAPVSNFKPPLIRSLSIRELPGVAPVMTVLTTNRLVVRRLSPDDAEFIVELLNDPTFLRFIGDKAVRTADDARRYISDGPVASYEQNGFGLWLVELKGSHLPVGMCGLLKRETLVDVDIGFAFLPAYRSQGYAFEAASAVLDYGRTQFGLKRIVAITNPENAGSIRVLEKIGMRFERMITVSEGAPEIQLLAFEE
jgi:[ribosomal protein S5]-alanine N-acetyltransferase